MTRRGAVGMPTKPTFDKKSGVLPIGMLGIADG